MNSPEINANPSPNQAFELAAIAVCLAKNQGKLRESKKFENAQLFVPEQIDDINFENDRVKGTTHMFAGYVARRGYARHRIWNLWLVEKFWTDDHGQTDAYRTTYNFEWNTEEVVTSHRVIAAPQEEETVYDADRITVDSAEFNGDWLNAKYQMITVSRADCSMLLRELRVFSQFSQTPQRELHYNR